MKPRVIVTLFIVAALMTACNTASTTKEQSTKIRDIVQSDVFDVLPPVNDDMLVYNAPDEIDGEYLELASVEITLTSSGATKEEMMKDLLKEARILGGNGVLVLSQTKVDYKGFYKQELKAIAVYALNRAAKMGPIVMR